MLPLILLILSYSVLAQESPSAVVETTVGPHLTTVESTVPLEVTEIGSMTEEHPTVKAQNRLGEGTVIRPKMSAQKDTKRANIQTKVANRHTLSFSGYDKDRSARARRTAANAVQNGYGDEPITPAANEYGGEDSGEGTSTQDTTTSPPSTTPNAQNGYGDEAVTPADEGYGSGITGGQDEYAPATVPQMGYGEESVQQSGYDRMRRANEYGDEQVTPSSEGKSTGCVAEEEKEGGIQGQEGVTLLPRETSGY
ncbi:hypothetical protein PMAYCL1PPCAC_17663 [Pristionchus mayeri]|uniref:Uncharacterized protein n=1 Tax=Pristionchus mayeri TaxID=1317129 RepID=A0AAN5CN46_9BILA|nr:hypothetical protein PMAYCL1PPCAC_17663 [Pristionchus mayeri]